MTTAIRGRIVVSESFLGVVRFWRLGLKIVLFASIVAAVGVGPVLAATTPATIPVQSFAVYHNYPIHYDGPMVHHGRPQAATDVTGNLPKFNVTFHGGPVQTSTVSYAIYWRPPGTYMSPHYKPLIDRFLTDAGGSAIYGMATTYTGSNGAVRNQSAFGGAWTDTAPYPAKGISDRDLQIEVLKAVSANKWGAGVNAQFFVMTAKDAKPAPQFCAYHSAFDYGFGKRIVPFVYAYVPYVGYINGCDVPFGTTPNRDVDADGSILNLSHEQMEMVTDPLLNAWYDKVNGEIGDICIFSFGVPIDNAGGNIDIGADPYFLQEDYSQARGSCQPNL